MLVAIDQYLQMTIDYKFYQQLQLRCYLLSSQLQVLDQYFPIWFFILWTKRGSPFWPRSIAKIRALLLKNLCDNRRSSAVGILCEKYEGHAAEKCRQAEIIHFLIVSADHLYIEIGVKSTAVVTGFFCKL